MFHETGTPIFSMTSPPRAAKPCRKAGAEPPRGGGVGKGEARAAAEWLRSAPQGAGEVGITFA